jgi:ABC-type transport system substrate-binding protein
MKTKRFVLAAALMISAAACTGNPTAPEAATRRPGAASPSTSETTTPTTSQPVTEPVVDDGTGQVGSGCCAKA